MIIEKSCHKRVLTATIELENRSVDKKENNMANHYLEQVCRNLSWTKAEDLKSSDRSETIKLLDALFEQYGYAPVLAALATVWKNDRALEFWNTYAFPQADSHFERLVIATTYTRGYNGGIERAHAQLMTIWTDMGHKVVFFSEEAPNENDYKYPSEVKRVIIPTGRKLLDRLTLIEKEIKEKQIKLFINHIWWDETGIWECVICRLLGVPYITYCHGLFSAVYRNGYEYGYLSYKAFRLNNLILSLSTAGARFNQMCGCRSYLVQNPIQEELKAVEKPADLHSHRILWIGRIDKDKRPEDAVKILAKVKQMVPDAVLAFVGQPEEETYLRVIKTASELGVTDSIEWRGYQSDVSEAFMSCGLMLFTSPEEGYPMSIIESKAYGVPCVMYALPYLSMTQDGKGIATARIGDTNALAAHVARLLQDDRMRYRMGKEARESFDNLLKYDIAKTWDEVFRLAFQEDNCNSDAFYNPDSIPEHENIIIPMLIDQFYSSMDSVRKDSVDYRIGNRILKSPRLFMKAFRKLCNHQGKV